jgi:hypothetical protein
MLHSLTKFILRQSVVTEALIVNWLDSRVCEYKCGSFSYGKVAGFLVELDGIKAFYPKRPVSYMNERWGRLVLSQKFALTQRVPIPLFMGEGDFNQQLHAHKSASKEEVDRWLERLMGPELAATYLLRYFSQCAALRPYLQIIYEGLEAYYMGMDHVAVMSLVPVIEGGLRNVQHLVLGVEDNNVQSEVFYKRLCSMITKHGERLHPDISIYPGKSPDNAAVRIDFLSHANPQCDVMASFAMFFKDVLYKPSRDVAVTDDLNRHLIVHMLNGNFASGGNYVRLFFLLGHIAFCERLQNSKIPMLWPGVDQDSFRLSKYFISLSTEIAERRARSWRPGEPFPSD